MDGDRKICSLRDAELFDENLALDLPRREIVVVIETDLAEGDDLRVGDEGAEIVVGLRRDFGRVVRVNAD